MLSPYGDPVTVTQARGELRPTSFTWRGQRYWVSVLASWRLRSRWWCLEPAERTSFRVVTADGQLFDLSHDHVSGGWVLDAVPE